MKTLFVWPILAIILNGCASLGIGEDEVQHDWLHERKVYFDNCEAWIDAKNEKLQHREPDESTLPLSQYLAKRCKEDRFTCTPPEKPERLVYFEKTYAKPVTAPGCVDSLQKHIDEMNGIYR